MVGLEGFEPSTLYVYSALPISPQTHIANSLTPDRLRQLTCGGRYHPSWLNENKREILGDAPYPFLTLGNPNLVTSTSGLIRS